jgi:tetratricopeptide (TPR) repeat protein
MLWSSNDVTQQGSRPKTKLGLTAQTHVSKHRKETTMNAVSILLAAAVLVANTSASATTTALPSVTVPGQSVASAPSAVTREDIDKLRESLAKTREELAELKPVASVTNTVFYFVAGLSALLGVFGWRKFSDLDSLVGEQVKLQLPRDKREFAEYEEMANSAQEIHTKLKAITADYESALSNMKYIDVLGEDFDIEGKLHILSEESATRKAKPIEGSNIGFEGTLYESSWRSSTIALLSRLPAIIKRRNLDAEMLFNAAQLCRRMDQYEIAQQVTEAAFEKSPSAANKALMLSSTVKSRTDEAVVKAFAELMDMIRNLGRDSPHIVLAEAWNAAVDQAAYDRLIEAIDDLVRKHEEDPSVFLPSYAYVTKALCILSQSAPGALQEAEEAAERAKEVLGRETTRSSWVSSSVSEIQTVELAIMQTRMLHASLAGDDQQTGEPTAEMLQEAFKIMSLSSRADMAPDTE